MLLPQLSYNSNEKNLLLTTFNLKVSKWKMLNAVEIKKRLN